MRWRRVSPQEWRARAGDAVLDVWWSGRGWPWSVKVGSTIVRRAVLITDPTTKSPGAARRAAEDAAREFGSGIVDAVGRRT